MKGHVKYGDLDQLNYIDILKMNALLDYEDYLLEEERIKMEKEMRKNGNKS